MTGYFCITTRFLQPVSHGRNDEDQLEWPPSPFRLFQALVNASAARWNERMCLDYAIPALTWLERRSAPVIIAPQATPADAPNRLYVPDNTLDQVARQWSAGREGDIAGYRSEKDVRVMNLQGDAVHFLFPLSEGEAEFAGHRDVLTAAARSITHLGWGTDMVAGNAEVLTEDEVRGLIGERWIPTADTSGTELRVPVEGTLQASIVRHRAFLDRLTAEGFRPVSPLLEFRRINYRRATDAPNRPWLALEILQPDLSGKCSFGTVRGTRNVAAMLRHLVGEVCADWPFDNVAGFVHGHDTKGQPLRGDRADHRFMFQPLPTINAKLKRVESIRRVLVIAPPGCREQVDWLRRRLPGQELRNPQGEVVGILSLLVASDWVLRQYIGEDRCWSTVTPVLRPGYDDRNCTKGERLLRKTFLQAGLTQDLLDTIESLEWGNNGYHAGVDQADKYSRPEQSTGYACHVRVRFAQPVRGPVVIGTGRYRGFGLFAKENFS